MPRSLDTLAVHAGDVPGDDGALDPPVVLSNAYAFPDAEEAAARFRPGGEGYIYSRWRNPTVDALEAKLAALEGAEEAVCLASGMAALHALFAGHLAAGDEVLAATSLYAETVRLLRDHFTSFGVTVRFVEGTPEAIAAAVTERTKLVHVETPANPTLRIVDLAGVVEAVGGRALVSVDGTFATPYHQRPLEQGADLVVHSTTKGLSGHGDAVGGVVAGRREVVDPVRKVGTRTCGGVLAPLTAMLVGRGVRTLGVRMAKASENARILARRLEEDRRIAKVHYPGLPSDPGHEVAARQMSRGFGPVLAFEVEGGLEAGRRAYDRVALIARAVSLGDVRSLLTHAASTTHASLSAEERSRAGLSDGLLRLSAGIEDVEDLWADLDGALG
jgi:methionine-gamma-lyase